MNTVHNCSVEWLLGIKLRYAVSSSSTHVNDIILHAVSTATHISGAKISLHFRNASCQCNLLSVQPSFSEWFEFHCTTHV